MRRPKYLELMRYARQRRDALDTRIEDVAHGPRFVAMDRETRVMDALIGARQLARLLAS